MATSPDDKPLDCPSKNHFRKSIIISSHIDHYSHASNENQNHLSMFPLITRPRCIINHQRLNAEPPRTPNVPISLIRKARPKHLLNPYLFLQIPPKSSHPSLNPPLTPHLSLSLPSPPTSTPSSSFTAAAPPLQPSAHPSYPPPSPPHKHKPSAQPSPTQNSYSPPRPSAEQ